MTAGMMPIALGFSGDSSFRRPMAIAVIGGLMTSTLLSLIVIPAAFTVLDDLGEWVKHRGKRDRSLDAAAGDVG
jgi:Cu/Ag efflux pump CusA